MTAQKTLVVMDIDKLTYKVEDDIDAKTSTVLDMLRKVPMVSVDGKPNPMMSAAPSQVFRSMPASFVKNIEVVTNPGARYDAEGVGGVLNITTISDKSGGKSIADGQYDTIGVMGTTRGGGGNVFYSMQKGKWAFSLSYEIDSLNLITAGAGWMHFGMESEGPNASPQYNINRQQNIGLSYNMRISRPVITHLTMKAMEEMLPANRFMRVHRSYITALSKITSVDAYGDILLGDIAVPISETYRKDVDRYIQDHLLAR